MIRDLLERLQSRRMRAYRRTFDVNGPQGAAVRDVLADLATFCGHSRPSYSRDATGRLDPLAMAAREGRREVWTRIQAYLRLNDDDLHDMVKTAQEESVYERGDG